ncbi:MAG: hypothetical protein ABMA64_27235, partial [Myxococcota bacterium]
MSGMWALVRIELLTILRDRVFWVGLAGVVVLVVAAGPTVDAVLALRPPAVDQVAPSCGGDGPWAPVPLAVRGEIADLAWGPWVELRPDAAVQVVFSNDTVSSWSLRGEGDLARAAACVEEAVEGARRVRLARLGLEVAPAALTQVATPPLGGPGSPPVSVLGATLLGLGAMFAGSIALEAVPRRRASGLLEQLRSTRTTEFEVAAAWVLVAA